MAARAALHSITHDQVLLSTLRAGRLRLARAEADRIVFTHRLPGFVFINHVVRIRFVRRGSVVIDANRTNFAIAGLTQTLHRRDGAALGVLSVTVQDVQGYVKTVHDLYGFDLVARADLGPAASTLHPPPRVSPADGDCVTVSNTPYAVRSFSEFTFTGRPLTVWVLTTG